MGAGQSRNLFQAAKDNELERAIYFIENNKEDINVKDKVKGHKACWVCSMVPGTRDLGARQAWINGNCRMGGHPFMLPATAGPWRSPGSCCAAVQTQH